MHGMDEEAEAERAEEEEEEEEEKGRREEKRRLTCSICLLNTTRPTHQGRASERATVFAHQSLRHGS